MKTSYVRIKFMTFSSKTGFSLHSSLSLKEIITSEYSTYFIYWIKKANNLYHNLHSILFKPHNFPLRLYYNPYNAHKETGLENSAN